MKHCKRGHIYEDSKNRCPECVKATKKRWRDNNRNKVRKATKEYHKRSGANKVALQRYKDSLPGILSTLVSRAKARTSDTRRTSSWTICDITRDDLFEMWEEQHGLCALTKLEMTPFNSDLCCVSLDRIDSTKGYTRSNVQLVCKWVNRAKNTSPDSEILEVLERYRQRYNAK